MKKIFTKRFFDLSHQDQAAVVDAVILDLQSALPWAEPRGRRSLMRAIRRIERKAVEHGVYGETEEGGAA